MPFIGQTPAYLKNSFQFTEDGIADYGPVFKAGLIRRAVVMAGPEACERFIDPSLIERAGAFPGFVGKLVGGKALPFQDGKLHLQTKEIILAAFTDQALASYLPAMQTIVESYFKKWTSMGEFRWIDELKRCAFEIIWTNLFGPLDSSHLASVESDYEAVSAGLVSLPVPLPGTAYSKALQAKNRIFTVLRRIVNERKQSPQQDGVSLILAAKSSDGRSLTVDEIVLELHHLILAGFIVFGDLASVVLYATREAEVRKRLNAAVADIPKGTALTVQGVGRLHYLQQFVMEVKRLCPIIDVVFGRAKQDFELHGVTIPKGWLVLWAVRSTNIYRSSFRDRYRFDPDRFAPFPRRERQLHEELLYVPQSGGPLTGHACAGFDYSSLLISVFTLCLVRDHQWRLRSTSFDYDWKQNPPQPKDGLLATVS